MKHRFLQWVVAAGLATTLPLAAAQQSDKNAGQQAGKTAAKKDESAGKAGQPKLVLSMEEWDFGQKWFGEPAKAELTLTNAGTAPLKIIRVRSSCGCTVGRPKSGGTWNGKVIPPGGSEVMVLSYNTRKGVRKVSQKITIETNDPQRPRIEFTVRGEVRNIYEAKPTSRIIFGQINRDETRTQALELMNNLETPVELKLEPLPKDTPFEAQLEEVEKGKRYKLVVTTKPPLKIGSNVAKIVLRTGLTRVPTLTFPVTAYVRPRVSVVPRMLLVSNRIKRPFQRILRVNYRADKPLKITKVESSSPDITTEIIPPKGNVPRGGTASYQIRVNLPPGDKLPENGAKLIIYTDDPSPEYSKIEVEVITVEQYQKRIRERAQRRVVPVQPGKTGKPAAPKPKPATPAKPEKKTP